MLTAIIIVFWCSTGLAFYTLCLYPLLAMTLAAIVRRHVKKGPFTPRLTLIIAAYNEERAIRQKLEHTLALDYPKDKLEVIVASDGSADRTDEIVREFAHRGVRLFRTEGRLGKTATLNAAVATATGDILVFSDATGRYNSEALRELASNFNDPTVGCVTGRVAYRYGTDATSKGFSGYQKIAVAVRMAETRFGSQTSVSGSIHAIRRELYRPADPGFTLDVANAVHTVIGGLRVVYERNAVSLEESRENMGDEFRCRVRISVRVNSMIPYILRQLFGHGRLGYAFQMISHKILRWWLWFLLCASLITNTLLIGQGRVYAVLAVVQLSLYGLGLAGLLVQRLKIRLPLVPTLSFFIMGNTAMCVGAIKRLVGRRMPTWQPVR